MRRHLVLAAAIAGLLLIVSAMRIRHSGTRRTVTAVVTVSSGADAVRAPRPPPAHRPAAKPRIAGRVRRGVAQPVTVADQPSVVRRPDRRPVDPLKVDCAAILSAADVKKIFNVDIPNDRIKVNVAEVNGDVGQTGRVRCLYGLSADKKSGAFSLALTQYTDAAAAQTQVDVTVQNESRQRCPDHPGARSAATRRPGRGPRRRADRDALRQLDHGDRDVAQPIDPATLATGLPQLAEAALARILKS